MLILSAESEVVRRSRNEKRRRRRQRLVVYTLPQEQTPHSLPVYVTCLTTANQNSNPVVCQSTELTRQPVFGFYVLFFEYFFFQYLVVVFVFALKADKVKRHPKARSVSKGSDLIVRVKRAWKPATKFIHVHLLLVNSNPIHSSKIP